MIIAFPLMWLSRGDMDMLMLSGAFMVPHLMPFNLLPLTPAVARLSSFKAFLAFLHSWLPFSANWIGNNGWWSGWIFVVYLWTLLAYDRYKLPIDQ
ncbi:MAG: hypothetical protein WBV22_08320 [Anaerolineaceae bacterium]